MKTLKLGTLNVVGLLAWACSTRPAHVAIINAPGCRGVRDDLGDYLEMQAMSLSKASDEVVLPVNAVSPHHAIAAARELQKPRLVFYSGHGFSAGREPHLRTQLCLEHGDLDPEDLLSAKGSSRSSEPVHSTLVLNSCYSNYTDLHERTPGVSIISSSFEKLSDKSGFAEATADALKDPKLDQNCDGIVTDEELFNKMLSKLLQSEQNNGIIASVEFRAQPLLQRHARGQVPLPIKSRCETLIPAPALQDAVLKNALEKQERYAQGSARDYPTLDWDYFIIVKSAHVSDARVARLTSELTLGERGSMLRKFPGSYDDAVAVARYAVFTEVFAVEMHPPAVRIVRLRDNSLLATRLSGVEAVAQAFPFRDQRFTMEVDVENDQKTSQIGFRILRDSARLGSVEDGDWTPSPCERTLVGECFTRKLDQAIELKSAVEKGTESSSLKKATDFPVGVAK